MPRMTRRAPRALANFVLSATALLLLNACSDSGSITGSDTSSEGRRPAASTPANPLAGSSFYVEPSTSAATQAAAWRASRPADAAQMDRIASRPQALWFGGWNADVAGAVSAAVGAAAALGKVPVLVAYNIPQRDCGGLSGGGGATADAYRGWIAAFARGIAGRRAVVIVEPDALAMLDCLSAADRQLRVDLLRYAVQALKAQGATVYLDAGHAGWHPTAVIAERLIQAGVAASDGFSLNVSNYGTTAANTAYGAELSGQVAGKHFVIDTSRNGLGPAANGDWCNPSGRALGAAPTAATGHPLVDAFLWIKRPGESDGACNGGPAAGQWWAEYALGLAQRSTI